VSLEGYALEIRPVNVVAGKDYIRGLYNGLRPLPALRKFGHVLKENEAWQVAEAAIPVSIATRLESRLVLLDLVELTTGSPSSEAKMYWHLAGEDKNKINRFFLVDATTGALSLTNPEQFNFDLPREHHAFDVTGPLIYRSGGFACSGGPGCPTDVANQSHLGPRVNSGPQDNTQPLAELLPAVLDLWYRQSTTPGPVTTPAVLPAGFRCNPVDSCFGVPFPRVLDLGTKLTVSVMHKYPGIDPNAPVASITLDGDLTVTHNKNSPDIIGHEWGHVIGASRGFTAGKPGGANGQWAVFDFNEAFMDVFGVSTEALLNNTSDFSLNKGELYLCPNGTDPYVRCVTPSFNIITSKASDGLTFQWPEELGDCNSVGSKRRKAFGRIFYSSFRELIQIFGAQAIQSDFNFFFRAWIAELFRTWYLSSPNFTTILDFYAASVARFEFTAPNGIGPRLQELNKQSIEGALYLDRLPPFVGPTGFLGAACLQ